MRFLLVLLLLILPSCVARVPARVCTVSRCAPDEEFNLHYCSCELRSDALTR